MFDFQILEAFFKSLKVCLIGLFKITSEILVLNLKSYSNAVLRTKFTEKLENSDTT